MVDVMWLVKQSRGCVSQLEVPMNFLEKLMILKQTLSKNRFKSTNLVKGVFSILICLRVALTYFVP